MSSQNFNAGQAKAMHRFAKAQEWVESAKDTTQSARDKTADADNATSDSCQQKKEEAAGFLQQTGEQVMNMAHGAMEGVKNTLGVNDNTSHNHMK
ncbi:hypothetical protein MKW94_021098 [Papaver nudicaule]|uniref:Late embryogenesis abundant protein 1-like n=1 Tax=Papaver nudicaule TaxID=74823 RepID=A0AA41SJP7_PAPNU|nr:hypothetical protein [Papaver nudicaule]